MDLAIFAVYLFVCVVAAALCLQRPAIALVLVLILWPMKTIFQSVLPILVTTYQWPVNVGVGLIAMLAAGLALTKGYRPVYGLGNATTWLLVTLYALILASLLWTPTFSAAMFFLSANWPYAILLFFIAPLLINDLKEFDAVIKVFLVLGAITAFFVIVNPKSEITHDGRLALNLAYIVGKGDVFTNPLALADMCATMALAAAVYRPKRPQLMKTVLQVLIVAFGVVMTYLSGSRGQLIAALAIIVMFWPLLKSRASAAAITTTLIGSSVIAGLAISLYVFVFADLLTGRWGSANVGAGASDRFSFAMGLIEGYMSSPAFWLQGLGAAAFNSFIRVFDVGAYYYPHNIAVEALAEYGVFGFTLLTAICVATARKWYTLYRITGVDVHNRSLCVILIGITLFHFFMSLKQGSLLSMPILFTLCLVTSKLATRVESELAEAGDDVTAEAVSDEISPEEQAEIERAQAEYEAGRATA